MISQKIIIKKCIDDNIVIHPHCNSPYCSQKVLEINPAIGCEFQCQYCCLFTQESENKFSHLTIYEDYPSLLENYIVENKKTLNGYMFFFSFESDCFQNALISSGLTQKIFKVLQKYNQRYFILTKGALPNNEIGKLLIATKQIGQVIVNDTIPNEDLRRILEPCTATNKSRFDLVKFCVQNNIFTTVSFSPILPFVALDYLKEKIDKYLSIGIDHFRLDMLQLSNDSYNKLVRLLPSYKNEMDKIFMNDDVVETTWQVPYSENTIKRYKPSKEFVANTYYSLKNYIKSKSPYGTVSVCDADIANNELLSGINKEARENGINCMGVKIT